MSERKFRVVKHTWFTEYGDMLMVHWTVERRWSFCGFVWWTSLKVTKDGGSGSYKAARQFDSYESAAAALNDWRGGAPKPAAQWVREVVGES